MFKRTVNTETTLAGSWRADIPQTLRELQSRGFGTAILSSAQIGYIQAALDIYAQQFSEDPTELFDEVLITRDFDEFGNKYKAFPAVAEAVIESDRQAIFVDDAKLVFDGTTKFVFVYLPSGMQYRGGDSATFEAPLEL